MHNSLLNVLATLLLLVMLASGTAYADQPLRDPTRPYTPIKGPRASSPSFVVNAIIISPERRVAIVNGRRLAVGGSLDGATVVSIEKDHLILETGGKRIRAELNKRAMRR